MIAIIDYGAGNIFSVKNALDYIGLPSLLTDKKEDIENADGIILPGVGAFPSAMNMLKEKALISTIQEQARQKPFHGICLGMQLIFDKGYEFGETTGLSLIHGTVEKMVEPELNIPHIGWNKLEVLNECPLLQGLSTDEYVYFVHSYKAVCKDENISAFCEYGSRIPALVSDKNIYGAQFHPEKSGKTGLQILKNFGGLL